MKQNKSIRYMFGDWTAKMLAFMTALFVVIAIRFFNITDRVVKIPITVSINQTSDYVPVSLIPESIDVIISGDEKIIYLVDPTQIKAYADFSDVDSDGIARRNVRLVYDKDIFSKNSLTVQATPASVRILFESRGTN